MQGTEDRIMAAMALKGRVTVDDLAAELKRIGGAPDARRTDRMPPCHVTTKEGRANLLVEVQTDGDVYLSFRDRTSAVTVTVRIDPVNIAVVAAMLEMASEKEVDSKCYVTGDLGVKSV